MILSIVALPRCLGLTWQNLKVMSWRVPLHRRRLRLAKRVAKRGWPARGMIGHFRFYRRYFSSEQWNALVAFAGLGEPRELRRCCRLTRQISALENGYPEKSFEMRAQQGCVQRRAGRSQDCIGQRLIGGLVL